MELLNRYFGSRRYTAAQDDDSDDDSLPLPTPLVELLNSTHISPQVERDESSSSSPVVSGRKDKKGKKKSLLSAQLMLDYSNEAAEEAQEGMCVECVDQPASLHCEQCQDDYCSLCWKVLHKRGNRAQHITRKIDTSKLLQNTTIIPQQPSKSSTTLNSTSTTSVANANDEVYNINTFVPKPKRALTVAEQKQLEEAEQMAREVEESLSTPTLKRGKSPEWFVQKSKCIPLRLATAERQLLKLLETGLNVSEYTDKIDVYHRSVAGKQEKIVQNLEEICSIISGLKISSDYRYGAKLLLGKEFKDNEELFQTVFEVGRRYKIMNPEKMRAQYGKLVYLLQDANLDHIKRHLGFQCVRHVTTVYDFLKEKLALDILIDPNLSAATMVISDDYGALSREQVAAEAERKEVAIQAICKKYARQKTIDIDPNNNNNSNNNNSNNNAGNKEDEKKTKEEGEDTDDSDDEENQGSKKEEVMTEEEKAERRKRIELTEDEIKRVLSSIGDNLSFLNSNRGPVDRMIIYLDQHFSADSAENDFSLTIRSGSGGARLSHDHQTQYHYVKQSFVLWREICGDMFRLWYLSELDLIHGNGYRLSNTGQGLNRMQPAPRVGQAMSQILDKCRRKVEGYWVGSSAVHLGDTNVPNALMFIDKYTQVARILAPIVRVIEELDKIIAFGVGLKKRDEEMEEDHKEGDKVMRGILKYIEDNYESGQNCKKVILRDFFRHGFDGSGADDYFSAGSCIDGRLTSAWNWCSLLEKKEYFPVFKMLGFVGFDGRW